MIKAIFWDNDGILVDTEHLYFEATKDIFATEGVTLTEELYREWFLISGNGAWHFLSEKGYSAEEIAERRAKRNAIYSALLGNDDLTIKGVKDVVAALSEKYLMGIVTSSRREHFDVIHRNTCLLPYFQFVLAAGDYERTKPDPAPYLAALSRTKLSAAECLVIEDSRRGLDAALSAGLRCVVIPSRLTIGQDFKGAEKVLDSVGEFSQWLQQNSG